MKNKTSTFIALALSAMICACCLSSCGMNNGTTDENDSMPSPSEIMSDVVDDVVPDTKDGRTVDENSDEYTADEKDGDGFMSDMFGGK